jgi:hypothetical protein
MEKQSADCIAKRCSARLTNGQHPLPCPLEALGEQPELGGLPRAFRTLENDQSSSRHGQRQESVMMELVAPFFIPSMIQLFT